MGNKSHIAFGWLIARATLWAAVIYATSLHVDIAQAAPADDQFNVAARHFTAQRWSLAATEFEAFVDQFPQHARKAEALFFLGETYVQLRRPANAAASLEAYLKLDPQGPYRKHALFRAGEAAQQSGQIPAAQQHLQSFLQEYPEDPLIEFAAVYQAQMLLSAGKYQPAQNLFELSLKKSPQGPMARQAQFGLAQAWEKQGELPAAMQTYRKLVELPAGALTGEALFNLGTLEYSQQLFPAARADFAKLLQLFPQHALADRARLGQAWSCYRSQQFAEAEQLLKSISTKSEVADEADYWLALTEKALGKWPEAAQRLEQLAGNTNDKNRAAHLLYQAADAWRQAGDPPKADHAWQQVGKLAPQGEWADDALWGRIMLADQADERAAVSQLAETFFQQFPQSSHTSAVQRLQAKTWVAEKKYAEAVQLLEHLQKQEPAQFTATDEYLLGLSYYALQTYEKSIAPLARCLQSQPADALKKQALTPLLLAQAKLGHWAEAKAAFVQWENLKPADTEWAETIHPVAEWAFAAGEVTWANELFAQLGKHQPTGQAAVHALSGQAWSLYRAGKLAEAASVLERLLKEYPQDAKGAESSLLLGEIYEQQQQTELALAALQRVVQQYPQTLEAPRAMLRAAELHRNRQQTEKALSYYRRLLANHAEYAQRDAELPSADSLLFQMAWLERERRQTEESLRLFSTIHENYPRSRFWLDSTYRLAEARYAAHDAAGTSRYLQSIFSAIQTTDDATPALTLDGELALRVYYLQGIHAVAQQQWASVPPAMQQVLQLQPNDNWRHLAEYWMAEAEYRLGNGKQAIPSFQKLMKQGETLSVELKGQCSLRVAQALFEQRDEPACLELIKQFREEYPKHDLLYEFDYLQGRCHTRRAEFDEARAALQRVVISETGGKLETAAMAQWMMGETYYHQRRYNEAIRAFMRVEALYPYPQWQAAAVMETGKCYEQLQDKAAAAQCYQMIIKRWPDSKLVPDALNYLQVINKQN